MNANEMEVGKGKVGQTYLTPKGNKVKVLKIEKDDGEIVVTVMITTEDGKRQKARVPGSQPVLKPGQKPATEAATPADEAKDDDAPEAEAKGDETADDGDAPATGASDGASSDEEPAKPEKPAKGGKKPKAEKPAKAEKPEKAKPAKAKASGAKGATYEDTLKRYKDWWSKSVAEVKAALKEAKEKDAKPPDLSVKWFLIETLMSGDKTAEQLVEAVRKTYSRFNEGKARREVYRHLFLEGKRVTKKKVKGKPTIYAYAKS